MRQTGIEKNTYDLPQANAALFQYLDGNLVSWSEDNLNSDAVFGIFVSHI